jgi:hypothetical protein
LEKMERFCSTCEMKEGRKEDEGRAAAASN